MMQAFELTALILAGGQAQRMGGVDKGLQEYQGVSMARRLVDLVSPLCVDTVISANRNIKHYRALTRLVVSDAEPWQDIGPLGGICSALKSINSSHLLIVPCDTPCLSREALLKLSISAQQTPDKVHYLESESGRQPLHAVLPVNQLKQKLPDFLKNTEHFGVMKFYKTIGAESVYWEHDEELVNINRIEQLV